MYKTKQNESELRRREERERERERDQLHKVHSPHSLAKRKYTMLVFCAVPADFWLDKRERIFVVTLLI